jgi:hypothetical protein
MLKLIKELINIRVKMTQSIINGADLKFTQKAGAIVTGALAQADEPGIITLPDGRKLKVTIELQAHGVWKKVETSKLPNAYLTELVEKCQQIYTTTTHATGQPKSLTVVFKNNNASESLKSSILGKFSNRFKEHVVQLDLKKIEYKIPGSDQMQVFDLETNELEAADAIKVNTLLNQIAPFAKRLLANAETLTSLKKRKRSADAEPQSRRNEQQLNSVKRVLNVQDAGAAENRCASLSIASILLHKHSENLQNVAAKYKIPLKPQPGEPPLVTLSNGLIALAADIIETNPIFSDQDPRNVHFDNIVAALADAGQTISDPARPAVVKQYADLIRRPWQMLDIPVFDALQMHGIPFITLVPSPSQDDLILGAVSHTISFDSSSIDTYDLTTICFVVREGLHYQPVIMDAIPPNPAQVAKLRSILKNDMTNTLRQIAALVAKPGAPDTKFNELTNLMNSVVNRYPVDAKPIIIQMLTDERRLFDKETLRNANNNGFIQEAVLAFLS